MSSEDIEIDETLPEVVKNFLRAGARLQNISLTEKGEWKHEGLDFENPKIIDLFSRSVGRTRGGTWVLEIGQYTYPITVERTGYFVVHVDLDASPPVLSISDGTREPLDVASVTYEPDGKLFCRIKSGEFEARFKRAAYYALATLIHETDDGIALCISGHDPVVLAG